MTENDTLDLKELNTAISSGIIDIAYVREKNEMNRREKILKNHPYSVWQGKDGKWYTYLPDDKRPNGRLLKKERQKMASK